MSRKIRSLIPTSTNKGWRRSGELIIMHGKESSKPAVGVCESTIGELKQLGLTGNTKRGKFWFKISGVTKHENFIGKDK